jgi:23S rRNA pseudouridine2604 synthase
MEPPTMERVAKLMAARGLCSRREAERLIDAGQVLVDGQAVQAQGAKAAADADIRIAPAGVALLGDRVTIALHKPVGIVSTQPEPGQTEAWQLVRADRASGAIDRALLERLVAQPSTLSVVGRLDRASRGLLLLTQDGTVARRVIGGQGVEKAYLVRTAEAVTDTQIAKLNGPLGLDEQPLLPMRVTRVGGDALRFVLVEGKKHQIRRACQRFGLTVVDLFRTAIGPIEIGDLAEGRWRLIGAEELDRLRQDGRVGTFGREDKRQKAKGKRQKFLPDGIRLLPFAFCLLPFVLPSA